ncbi:MAG: glycogen debranching N-terminal domain-containing protein [Actinomycetota bacterium]
MDPREIFERIIKADERLKYARPEQADARRAQAREILERARDEAREIGNEDLVRQAERRLADLDKMDPPPPIAGGAKEIDAVPFLATPSSATGADRPMRHEPAPDGPRPTPADPLPGAAAEAGVPSAKREKAPPELGTDAIAILEGRTFMYSDDHGDVPAGSVGGLVHLDTRFLSRWEFTVNGSKGKLLRAHDVDYYSASFFLANRDLPGLPQNTLAIRRARFVGDGLREKISVHSYFHEPVQVELRLAIGADYADLFEIKSEVRDRSDQTTITEDADHHGLVFRYEHERFVAETHIHASAPCEVDGTDLVWHATIAPNDHWATDLRVRVSSEGRIMEPTHEDFGERRAEGSNDPLMRWRSQVPKFTSDAHRLEMVFARSVDDLAALRIQGTFRGEEFVLPAAGLPWFMTLFGRDTLITSYQSIWVGPQLAHGALAALGLLQGKQVDDFKDEEPGKILHEGRTGELTMLGLKPHSPYYGAVDTTPLWLVMLNEYWRWTADDDFIRAHWDGVTDALDWIATRGDRDHDGYIEYATRSSQGLGNQCWRDSWNGVQFADGTIPYLPIAIAEAQGYVYDAKLRVADMAEVLYESTDYANKLRAEANELKDRFNQDFWVDDRGGYYAIGLDADKRKIDSMTSNMGHLLWSGIVPRERARTVADRLLSDELFSGWGVRTLSTEDVGFNPIGYHLGTVWPHDNSLIVDGLVRYGFRDEANRICLALLEAAGYLEDRLPEAFSGFSRDIGRFPVPYPTACSPQAWATGAPFLFVRAMLGMQANDGHLTVDPHVPEELGRILIHGMHAFGARWDVEAVGTSGNVRLTQ